MSEQPAPLREWITDTDGSGVPVYVWRNDPFGHAIALVAEAPAGSWNGLVTVHGEDDLLNTFDSCEAAQDWCRGRMGEPGV